MASKSFYRVLTAVGIIALLLLTILSLTTGQRQALPQECHPAGYISTYNYIPTCKPTFTEGFDQYGNHCIIETSNSADYFCTERKASNHV